MDQLTSFLSALRTPTMATEDWIRIFQTKVEELDQGDSWCLKFDDSIVPHKQDSGWQQYIKSAFARFTCSKCKRGWPSNKVMVVFHMRLLQRQGTVKVRRFRQKCRQCQGAPMERAHFDSENIDVIMEKLMEKIRIKCYHEDVGEKDRPFIKTDVKGPHEASHCEACIQGICARMESITLF